MITKIVKRDGSVVDYDRERIEDAVFCAASANDISDCQKFSKDIALRVEELLVGNYSMHDMPTVEEIQDVVEKVLMEYGASAVAKSYILYRNQRAMERAARQDDFQVADMVPYKKIYEVLWWNMQNHCTSVDELNELVRTGQFQSFARLCEERYENEVKHAAHRITERAKELKLIIVAGPSSSGKTTTASKLESELESAGLKVKTMNLDDYFFDKDTQPKDEFGDFDYERPSALDLRLISEHLGQLVKGQSIRMPSYNFETGKRQLDVTEMALAEGELILIDSLHGLYSEMTDSIADDQKFKVYIECLGQVRGTDGSFFRWADNRLLRRMSRDRLSRNMDVQDTLTHWHYVRKSELQNIIPYINEADVIINTALPYEFAFWKRYLFDEICRLKSLFVNDPKRLDAHMRVNRVYKFLKDIISIDDSIYVPDDALIREFLGTHIHNEKS